MLTREVIKGKGDNQVIVNVSHVIFTVHRSVLNNISRSQEVIHNVNDS
jgi:hypothetical protein